MPEQPVRVAIDPAAATELSPGSADAAMRLPAGSPARVELITAVVLRLIDATNRRDLDALLDQYHPEMEMHTAWAGDFEPVYRGREELTRAAEQWFEPWSELRIEPYELIDLGGDQFVALAKWHGRGRGSGVEVETDGAARSTLREGKIVRIDWIGDVAAALRELGV
jgi:ketosteroid isomerase-like protein